MIADMPYPTRLLTEGEHVIREFRPHWRMLVVPLFWTLLFGVIAGFTWMLPPDMTIFDWVITGVALVLLIRFGLYPLISWWFTSYVLTNERLITRSGVLARRGLEIPLENINDVQFSQTILERTLRSGDLLIESAGELGQSRFSDIPDPEAFQSLLYRVREDRSKALQHPGSPDTPAAPPDAMSRLERLAKLRQDGHITDEEYEAKKQALLDEF
jgi:uncharacterized membrane protein YdbT with pleckstrin-like domain